MNQSGGAVGTLRRFITDGPSFRASRVCQRSLLAQGWPFCKRQKERKQNIFVNGINIARLIQPGKPAFTLILRKGTNGNNGDDQNDGKFHLPRHFSLLAGPMPNLYWVAWWSPHSNEGDSLKLPVNCNKQDRARIAKRR